MTLARKGKSTADEEQRGRLEARLDRLATDPKRLVAERRELPAKAPERLRALIAEIDETVLPRLLILNSDKGEAGRLIVSHRRLIDVILPDAEPASAEPQHLVRRAAHDIAALSELPGTLSLTVARRDSAPARPEPDCSVHALERALGLSSPGAAFGRLVQRLEPLSLARMNWKDDPAAASFSGKQVWRAALQTYVAAQAKAAHARKSRIGPTRTEGLVLPISKDHVMLLARLDKQGFAAILPREAGLDALAAWQAG